LISFLGFCFLIYEKLGITFHDHFKNKTILVKNSFLRSLEKVLIQLKKKQEFIQKQNNLNVNFKILKKYYQAFSTTFLTKLLTYLNSQESISLSYKLNELNIIEKSFSKIIVLLLLKKTFEIVLITKFLEVTFKIKRFKAFRIISTLHLINKI